MTMRAIALLLAGLVLGASPAAGTDGAGTPHDFEKIGCTHCHLAVPGRGRAFQRTLFRKNIDDLCQECHAAALEDNLNHRVGIRPSMRVPADLHLNERGELSCVTCHDPHGEYVSSTSGTRTWFLRRQMLKRELCLACHADENFEEPRIALTLLAPANNAVVDALPVPLIGTVSQAGVGEVDVEINDARLVLSVEHGTFSTMLKLKDGINTVRISGRGLVPEVLNILFNPALPREMTYRLYRSHGMANRKDCFVCHDREAHSFAITGSDAALCGRCHEQPAPARFVHGPVAVGSCTVCHDPHGQTNPSFLVASGEALCFRCHSEADVLKHLVATPESGGAFLREKGCTFCHSPHQAERRYLLREKT
ncbi:MAG TPA: cytochrome c3 family protein [Candidatus Methanoperedens sp.]|nr:cytochrome c3 family protein [Candidatus Methanoperedens sp.]